MMEVLCKPVGPSDAKVITREVSSLQASYELFENLLGGLADMISGLHVLSTAL